MSADEGLVRRNVRTGIIAQIRRKIRLLNQWFSISKTSTIVARNEDDVLNFRDALRSTWSLAKPFLLEDPDRRKSWMFAGLGLALCFVESWIMVKFSYVKRDYNSAMQKKDEDGFWKGILLYVWIILAYIPVACVQSYAISRFSLAWQKHLMQSFLRQYLSGKTFYALQLGSLQVTVDNPDQRISEDTSSFVEHAVSLFSVVIDSVMTVVSMSAILLSISTDLCVFLIVYAIVGTVVAIRIFGQRMMALARTSISQKATIRFYLIRVREHAESVAFYGGQEREFKHALSRVEELFGTLVKQTFWHVGLSGFNKVYKYTTFVLPIILVAPKYFRGDVEFGVVAQTSQAFIQILFALSLIVSKFETISTLGARVVRLERLAVALQNARAGEDFERIELTSAESSVAGGNMLLTSALSLYTPNGKTCICQGLDVELAAGSALLIMGESGIGKSSLLRAFAGLWSRGSGTISLGCVGHGDQASRPFFLSQQCYMTLGSLRDQVRFPKDSSDVHSFSDSEIIAALELARLPLHRKWSLDDEEDWGALLSMGEQQRLAFARVFLHRPALVFLDESTSALDLSNERHLYIQLRSSRTSFVSVGHRQSLLDYHDKVLLGNMGEHGPRWKVRTALEFRESSST